MQAGMKTFKPILKVLIPGWMSVNFRQLVKLSRSIVADIYWQKVKRSEKCHKDVIE